MGVKKLKQSKIELPTRQLESENSEIKQKVDRRKSMPHLFKKGQSGNPAGKPEGTLSWKSIIIKAALKEVELRNPTTGEVKKKMLAEIIAEKLLEKAKQGDMRAIEQFGDRIEGKPAQAITGSLDLTSKIVYLPPKEK